MPWNDVIDLIMMNEYARYREGLKRKENTMKEFTKKDLQNGDVVKLRDGQVGIVLKDDTFDRIIFPDKSYYLAGYEEDLTCSERSDVPDKHNVDIMAVRRAGSTMNLFGAFTKPQCGKLLYERKEVEEMTLEEVCKALGKEIKIVKSKGGL